MGPKKTAAAVAGERKKEKVTLEMKKEIIQKHDGGMRVTDIAREYGRNPSTIRTILKMREKILATDAAKGVTRIVKNHPAVLEEVEKLLLIWIEEKQRAGDTVSEAVICEKAKALHADLIREQPGTSGEPEVFKASRGWFERFKTRSGIHRQDLASKWKEVQTFAEQHHPEKHVAHDVGNIFDTRVMSPFREVLKRRMKQQTMDRFLSKKQRVEEEPSSSGPPES
ncbi:putative CENPB DNA-binding domain-containing protein 1 [Podarcis muralis]